MRSSILRLLGLAALLVAVALGFAVTGSGVAQAHPGHDHGHPGHAHPGPAYSVHVHAVQTATASPGAAHVHAVVPAPARNTATDVASTADVGSLAATRGAASPDGSAAGGGCTAPGCCGGGPCSMCCSVVPVAAGLVWPSRAALVLGENVCPALHDAVSFGLKRPPRSFA